jgi:hypothetical protein
MNRVSTWDSMLTGLVAFRRYSTDDVAVDCAQQNSGFGDSHSRESGDDALSFWATPHYGPHDPVSDAPKFLWACSCGARPVLRFTGASQHENTPESDSKHGSDVAPHVVACPACGRSGKPGLEASEAITDWNKSNLYLDLKLDVYEVLPDAAVPGAEQAHGDHSQATSHPEKVHVDEQLTAAAALSTRGLTQGPRPHDAQAETTEQERS